MRMNLPGFLRFSSIWGSPYSSWSTFFRTRAKKAAKPRTCDRRLSEFSTTRGNIMVDAFENLIWITTVSTVQAILMPMIPNHTCWAIQRLSHGIWTRRRSNFLACLFFPLWCWASSAFWINSMIMKASRTGVCRKVDWSWGRKHSFLPIENKV